MLPSTELISKGVLVALVPWALLFPLNASDANTVQSSETIPASFSSATAPLKSASKGHLRCGLIESGVLACQLRGAGKHSLIGFGFGKGTLNAIRGPDAVTPDRLDQRNAHQNHHKREWQCANHHCGLDGFQATNQQQGCDNQT